MCLLGVRAARQLTRSCVHVWRHVLLLLLYVHWHPVWCWLCPKGSSIRCLRRLPFQVASGLRWPTTLVASGGCYGWDVSLWRMHVGWEGSLCNGWHWRVCERRHRGLLQALQLHLHLHGRF